ncbi:MAG: hypothetical protein Kow00121_05030 [Elainellaceae cyanobacterium]
MNSHRTASLKLLSSSEPQTYSLNPAIETVIGREPVCQIMLDSTQHGGVSRRHAAIRFRPTDQTFEISDLGSANGTFVNGQRLQGSQLLQSGDRIQLGGNGVEFSFEDPALPKTVVQAGSPPTTQPAPPFYGGNPNPVPAAPYSPAPAAYPPPSPQAVPAYQPQASASTGTGTNNGVKIGAIVGSVFAVILIGGLALQFLSSRSSTLAPVASEPSTANPSASDPSLTPSDSSSTPSSSASPVAAANVQTYTDPNGLFQINLPAGYATEARADGINISSPDGSFQGAITAARLPRQFTTDELVQSFVNQQNNNANLQNFTLQKSEPIERGVRVDWVGTLTSNVALDAVTHFFQSNNVVVEVDLFAVDRAFNEQDVSEANVILQSVQIGQ